VDCIYISWHPRHVSPSPTVAPLTVPQFEAASNNYHIIKKGGIEVNCNTFQSNSRLGIDILFYRSQIRIRYIMIEETLTDICTLFQMISMTKSGTRRHQQKIRAHWQAKKKTGKNYTLSAGEKTNLQREMASQWKK
jgi:hypothetical protein